MTTEHSSQTISKYDNEEEVTFKATIFDEGTAISVEGPVDMVIDQIEISPSDHSKDTKFNCGVSLTYRQTNEYHTHLGAHFPISPNQERQLVEWLHRVGGNYVIETPEQRKAKMHQVARLGKCASCGEFFGKNNEWNVMHRRENDTNLYYCNTDCAQQDK